MPSMEKPPSRMANSRVKFGVWLCKVDLAPAGAVHYRAVSPKTKPTSEWSGFLFRETADALDYTLAGE